MEHSRGRTALERRRSVVPGGMALLLLGAAAAAPRPAAAQMSCTAVEEGSSLWSSPLDRPVTLEVTGQSVPQSLDQVAHAAGVRLSYSGDNLPTGTPFCWAFQGIPLGQALQILLADAPLEPVAASEELVVLAPIRTGRTKTERPAVGFLDEPLYALEPLVVQVDTKKLQQRTSPAKVDIISGDELREQGNPDWTKALNGAVPGVWAWQPTTTGLTSSFGSIRGASTFGVQAPKVYIDGIELANPLVATRLAPEAIERIEVIRGPEGASLFGAGAIAGVTNIVTRHDGGGQGAPRLRFRSSLGLAGSEFAQGSAVSQDHSISLNLGSSRRSANLSFALNEAPEIVPGSSSRYLGMDGSMRWVGSKTVVTGTLRLSRENALLTSSPLLGVDQASISPSLGSQLGLARYTGGVRAVVSGSNRWTHTFVVGLDAYDLNGLEGVPGVLPSLPDSTLLAGGSGATRGTLRLSSDRGLLMGEDVDGTLSLALDQSLLLQRGWNSSTRSPIWNTGVSGSLSTSFFDRLNLRGGLRLDRNTGGTLATRVAALPSLGASVEALETGPLAVHLRTAYGRAIRWPEPPSSVLRGAMHLNPGESGRGVPLSFYSLGPEEQSGVEAGVDISLGSSLELDVTRFDQTSTGFVDVTLPRDGSGVPSSPLQAIGRIGNKGWEFQAFLRRGPLSLSGTFSTVDSRVISLGRDYEGDLLAGDRMLGVPSRTMGLSATWSTSGWSSTFRLSRAFDWVGYDAVRLSRDFAGSPGGVPIHGLRDYWQLYDGFTHLGFDTRRTILDGVTLLFSADNLLDRQVGEPDNATVLPGRTFSVGISAGLPWWK